MTSRAFLALPVVTESMTAQQTTGGDVIGLGQVAAAAMRIPRSMRRPGRLDYMYVRRRILLGYYYYEWEFLVDQI
jgi:hypothetical protein